MSGNLGKKRGRPDDGGLHPGGTETKKAWAVRMSWKKGFEPVDFLSAFRELSQVGKSDWKANIHYDMDGEYAGEEEGLIPMLVPLTVRNSVGHNGTHYRDFYSFGLLPPEFIKSFDGKVEIRKDAVNASANVRVYGLPEFKQLLQVAKIGMHACYVQVKADDQIGENEGKSCGIHSISGRVTEIGSDYMTIGAIKVQAIWFESAGTTFVEIDSNPIAACKKIEKIASEVVDLSGHEKFIVFKRLRVDDDDDEEDQTSDE